jgi:hypothetical protein
MKKNYLLAIASYPDSRQDFFNTYTSKRNKEYCSYHNLEYIEITDNVLPIRGKIGWYKTFKVNEIIKDLNNGDTLTYFDADMLIVNKEKSFLPDLNKSFAYSIDSGNTHCMGSFSLRINDWSRDLMELIIDENRYQNLINKDTLHEHKNTYSSFWEEFYDQASWYSLAGIKRHSDKSFWKLPNFGWHSAKDEWTKFSLDELERNVQIFPTNYNVTELPGESTCTYNINKINYNNVYIRHFAGGQKWRSEWYYKKTILFHLKHINPINYFKSYKNFYYPRIKNKIKKLLRR